MNVFRVQAKGIGRKDYSQGIESSVEPLIQSYQSEYADWGAFTLASGIDVQINFPIPSGKVVIGYDFYVTFPRNCLVGLEVSAYRSLPTPGYITVLVARKYGLIEEHIIKGVPFYGGMDVICIVHNYDISPLDIGIGFMGIQIDESQYEIT